MKQCIEDNCLQALDREKWEVFFEKELVEEEDNELGSKRTGELGMFETNREKAVWGRGEHEG